MDSMLDLFMGDPVYDEQKNVIRRDFGVKNIVALMVVGFIGYSLMCKMKPMSGKRKMKGGVREEDYVGFIFFSWMLLSLGYAIIFILSLGVSGIGIISDRAEQSFIKGLGVVFKYTFWAALVILIIAGWLT